MSSIAPETKSRWNTLLSLFVVLLALGHVCTVQVSATEVNATSGVVVADVDKGNEGMHKFSVAIGLLRTIRPASELFTKRRTAAANVPSTDKVSTDQQPSKLMRLPIEYTRADKSTAGDDSEIPSTDLPKYTNSNNLKERRHTDASAPDGLVAANPSNPPLVRSGPSTKIPHLQRLPFASAKDGRKFSALPLNFGPTKQSKEDTRLEKDHLGHRSYRLFQSPELADVVGGTAYGSNQQSKDSATDSDNVHRKRRTEQKDKVEVTYDKSNIDPDTWSAYLISAGDDDNNGAYGDYNDKLYTDELNFNIYNADDDGDDDLILDDYDDDIDWFGWSSIDESTRGYVGVYGDATGKADKTGASGDRSVAHVPLLAHKIRQIRDVHDRGAGFSHNNCYDRKVNEGGNYRGKGRRRSTGRR